MDIAVANVVIKNTKSEKIFHVLVISSDCTLFYAKSPRSYEIQWIAQNEWSWVSEFNIDRYLAEYSFRINRSQSKDTIFNKLMERIVERSPVSQSQLVCS